MSYSPCGSAGKESACSVGNLDPILGLGRSPGKGKGYSLQYSGLENSMDCRVRGVIKSRTRLSNFHVHVRLCYICRCLFIPVSDLSFFLFFPTCLVLSHIWLTIFKDLFSLIFHNFCLFWSKYVLIFFVFYFKFFKLNVDHYFVSIIFFCLISVFHSRFIPL